MTNTRNFLERELLNKIQYRKSIENANLIDSPMSMDQYAQWYSTQGSINTLKNILDFDLGMNGFHHHSSGLSINDVISVLAPIISSHNSECECHSCITNDVLQNFLNTERGIASFKDGSMITEGKEI
jgi:hypothetical protein